MRRFSGLFLHAAIVLLSLFSLILGALIWANGRTHPQTASAAIQPRQPQDIADPIDCTVTTLPAVGIDVSQGQNPNDALSFLTDLETDGYEVGTFDLSAGIPACLEIVIVFGLANGNQLDSSYTASEGTSLLNWVNGGGGLMLFGEWGFLKANTQPLFEAFGYLQQGDDTAVVSDTTDADPTVPLAVGESWVIYQSDNFSPHPAFNGVAAIELLRSSWLNDSANTLVAADDDADPANAPVLAVTLQGSGCAMLAADTNIVGDIDGAYQKEDNALFARQMVGWLTTCGDLSLTKLPNAPAVNAGELITFTMTAVNYRETAVTNTTITDAIPSGTTFVSAAAPFTGPNAAGVVTWQIGTLNSGESATVTLVVQVAEDAADETIISNTATINSNETAADSATAVVQVNATVPPIGTGSQALIPVFMVNFCQETTQYSDIVLALDTSGSMADSTEPGGPTKLAAATTAATEFLNLLTLPGDQAGIVTFSGTAVLQHPLSSDKASLIAALPGSSGGATRIDLALAEAQKALTGVRHLPDNSQVLILLTDGQPSETDAAAVLAQAAATKAAGIKIYTIGLGSDVNGSLLQAIATSAGQYYPAPSTSDLNQIYQEIAGSLSCP
ncbi:MAG: VWA domain-containing protein [Ardenticatenaceae bacterium]|nr:VWA domain-containing protein [Ardenticatenaceae bacterium]